MKLDYFKTKDFHEALRIFFSDLNIPVNYLSDEPTSAREILKDTWKDNPSFQIMNDVYFLGMVDNAAFSGNKSIDTSKIKSDYDGVLIFGVTLNKRENKRLPTRSQLAEIARAFNREFFYTPVVVVYKYVKHLAFANTQRLKYKQEWREGEKAGKVSLLRDIDITNLHSGHERILNDLKIPTTGKNKVDSFAKLYAYWQDVFSVNILNRKFYQELSNWYFWAVKEVHFPSEPTVADEHLKKIDLATLRQEHNAKNVIRLLTRFLFVWFVKEKKLIPEELFDIDYLKDELLKDLSPVRDEGLFKEANIESVYYKAILQNLFFASLNCPIKPMEKADNRKRGFRLKDNFGQHRDANYLMRYKDQFKNPEKFLKLINEVVPFLNGGLFECLDNKTDKIYIDGFSDNLVKPHQLIVPDYLFFGFDQEVDLSGVVGIKTNAYKKASVKGLIPILESYKFTIAENTPIEEDVALDPELLGKVFENLLASYNPETKTTARKQTGSFYTPREIVNYMVDESLIAYLKNSVKNWNIEADELDKQLHGLLSFDTINPFAENEDLQKQIIHSLDNCKILDPACGSGAFPMGILQKMVHILQKVDPENKYWQELQLNKAIKETEGAFAITDKKERKQKLIEINDAFDEKINDPDYARKLFLVEDCIYGVDIQPIATQISKLRFFISLIVDQKVDKDEPNFGIRALPNLETKFVAANTLIGIDKPKDQMALFENQEVKKLEQKLKNVRHRLFSAKSPATKRRLRDKDKEIREKMGELLVEHGWANETAKQLAIWDPYDQNASSPFFDSEWMFDIKDGFDVVIGNPPYIDSEMMVNTGQEYLRNYITQNYELTKGNWDIYIAFFENGFNSLKDKGILTYITPDKWIAKPFGKVLRKNLLKYLRIILRSGRSIFETVGVDSIVTIFEKQKGDYFYYIDYRNNDFVKINEIDKSIILPPYQLDIVFSENINLLIEITKNNKVLNDFNITCENACATSDAYKLKDILDDIEITDLDQEEYLKVINTGTVDKFSSRWGKKKMTYLGDKYLHPVVNKEDFIQLFPNTYSKKSLKKKLIIKGLTLLDASTDIEGMVVPGKSTLIIANNNLVRLSYISMIINSVFSQFYITERYSASSYNTGVNFTKDMINNLPVPDLTIKQELVYQFIGIVTFSKQKDILNANMAFNRVLDGLVFNFYFPEHMKERKIDILKFVEKDLKEVIQNRDFDQLPDDQKEKLIKQLHTKWTDPKSEIVKRMNSFAEKSLDILKPILESR